MSLGDGPSPNPATTPPGEDVGADTQRRFRHQACYAAMLSLALLDDEAPIAELYCEHHEDVILQLRSSKFRAIQVKTRLVGGVPFKATDDEIIGALCRFVALETKFSQAFESYVIASNVGFWHQKKNGSNLEFLLTELKAGSEKHAGKLVKIILKKLPHAKHATVLAALAKVEMAVTPGLDDAESKLRDQLVIQKPEFKGRRYDELKAAADALRDRIFEASSLVGLDALPEYLAVCGGSSQSIKQAKIIESKRIVKATVSEVLNHNLSSEGLLRSHQPVPISDLPRGMKKMEIKMAAGGLSVHEIDHLKDLKFSAEYLFNQWLYKYGSEEAQKYYEHLRVVVRGACLSASETSKQGTGLYAKEMLTDLRDKLEVQHTTLMGETPECREDHLLGMAAILTEECKVWWSDEFQLSKGIL